MVIDLVIFWAAAIVAVIGAIRTVMLRQPVSAILHLIVTLVALAVLFLQLAAEFIAVLQIIIYGGAIMVLFLFVIMLLNLRRDDFGVDVNPGVRYLGALLAMVLLAEFLAVFAGGMADSAVPPEGFGGIRAIGRLLFGSYVLPFELTGLLLLAAALAVVVVAREKSPREGEES